MTPSHGFDDAPDWETLARYRAGESTPEETQRLALWLADRPHDAELIEALDAAVVQHVNSISSSAGPVDVEGALARLHQRMDDTAPATPRLTVSRGAAPRTAPRRPHRWAIGGLAAAAAVAAITMGLQRRVATSTVDRPTTVATTAPTQEYRTAMGVIDTVHLADGTRILLGPASHLTVPSAFGHGTRDVTLEGIAHFSVKHDAAVPFAVRAGAALIRDVGTQFTVRTPSSGPDLRTSVAVNEGEVSVSSTSNAAAPTALHAGDRAEVRTDGSVVATRGAVRGNEAAWARGALVYEGTPLSDVADDLKRWYGLDLQLPDSALAARRLTATFERQDADQLLHTLGLALGMSVQRSGAVVTLRPATIGR